MTLKRPPSLDKTVSFVWFNWFNTLREFLVSFIDTNYNVSLGSGVLATTATEGFPYIPTCAGAPTGIPSGKTGLVPMIYDTTNDRLYIYNGGWKSALFA